MNWGHRTFRISVQYSCRHPVSTSFASISRDLYEIMWSKWDQISVGFISVGDMKFEVQSKWAWNLINLSNQSIMKIKFYFGQMSFTFLVSKIALNSVGFRYREHLWLLHQDCSAPNKTALFKLLWSKFGADCFEQSR